VRDSSDTAWSAAAAANIHHGARAAADAN